MPMHKEDILAAVDLLAFDVDGTLVDDDQVLSPRTAAAIKKAQAMGKLVTLATGKIYPSIEVLIAPLELQAPLVLANGAAIQDTRGNVLEQEAVALDIIQFVMKHYKSDGLDMAIFNHDSIYVLEENYNTAHIDGFGEKVTAIGDWKNVEGKLDHVCKLFLINRKDPSKVHELCDFLMQELGERITISSGAPVSIEVMMKGVTKANGLRKLCALKGIPLERVMAFGDQKNDLEMVDMAGVSVAVGNAIPEVKDIADFVIGTNNDHGVATFLEEIL